MKLRKALEKAKKERNINVDQTAVNRLPVQYPEERSAPLYRMSECVSLDNEKMADNKCIALFPDHPVLDDYKVLRTRIMRQTKSDGRRTIMITSPNPGDGKTITAINLAVTFAKEHDQTVLLVDADLKKQEVCKRMGLSGRLGLVDYLVDGRSLQDMIFWPCIDKLTVISGEKTVQESAEFLASPKMKALVSEMKERYDDRYILFDTPPLLAGADAMAFAQHVDGVLVVVLEGQTSMRTINKALEIIPKNKFLGFAINRSSSGKRSKYYR